MTDIVNPSLDNMSNPSLLVESNPSIDYLALQSSDNLGVFLVIAPFNGENFLTLNTSIYISLGAKDKLDFIDGSVVQPPDSSSNFLKWKKADYMVWFWILGSLSKEIVEAYIYCP